MKLPSSPSKSRTKASKSPTNKYYPPVGFYFDVRILEKPEANRKPDVMSMLKKGLSAGTSELDSGFQDVSGLSVQIDYEEIAEGGENRFVHRVPKAAKFEKLVLKRGLVTISSGLGIWCRSIVESAFSANVSSKHLVISLLDEERNPMIVWSVIDAYPVKWSVSNFNAMSNDLSIETMEFVYKRFDVLWNASGN
jgi:phage tail-like protein